MFCEKCGTRVEDGQPFCPNCGNRLAAPEAPAAPAAPAAAAPVNPGLGEIPAAPVVAPAPKKALKLPSLGGLTDKFNAQEGLAQIFYGCIGCLLIVCFILSLLKVFKPGSVGVQYAYASPFFTSVFAVLFTLAITFFVMDALGKFSFKWLWFFIAGAAALILIVFIITWIDVESKLSVGGWFFLLFQAGLTAVSILYLLWKDKK